MKYEDKSFFLASLRNQKVHLAMVRSTSTLLFVVICFLTSCVQTLQGKNLISEINAAKVQARQRVDEAERKRKIAKDKNEHGDRAEHDRLIEEAAELYGEAAILLRRPPNKRLNSQSFRVRHGMKSTSICNPSSLAISRN